MKYDELVSAVASSAGIPDQRAAARAVEATLGVLGTRLAGGQPSNVASQLPDALTRAMPAEGPGERFGLAEFYDRVAQAEGEGCTRDEARRHARAVLAALKVSLTGREYDHIAAQLPAEYADLLGTEPVQHH
jgi:uncharacterized protein (DUF2267 family)